MITIAELEEALQQAWNESIGDTGCVPEDFTIHSPQTAKVKAVFLNGSFAGRVQAWLISNKNATVSDPDLHKARKWLTNGPREGSKTAAASVLNAYDTQQAELIDLRRRCPTCEPQQESR